MFKPSMIGYGVFGLASFNFAGYLLAASPVSQYVSFVLVFVAIAVLGVGLLNTAGLITKGYSFSRKTFITGMIPAWVLLAVIGTVVLIGYVRGSQ